MRRPIGILLLACVAASGCGRPRPANPLDGAGGAGHGNLFPLSVGRTWTYRGEATVSFSCCPGTHLVRFEQRWEVVAEEQRTLASAQAGVAINVAVVRIAHAVTSFGALPAPGPVPDSERRIWKALGGARFLSGDRTAVSGDSTVEIAHLIGSPFLPDSLCLWDWMERVPHAAGRSWVWRECAGSTGFSAAQRPARRMNVAGGTVDAYPVETTMGARTRLVLYAADVGPVRFERAPFQSGPAAAGRNLYRFPSEWGTLATIAGDFMDLTAYAPR